MVGSRFAFARIVGGSAIARAVIGSIFIVAMICLFLSTVLSTMSLDFAIKALISCH